MIKEYNVQLLDDVMDIWLDTAKTAHDFIPETYWAKNFISVKSHYIPNSDTFVYEVEDGKICGFISIMTGNLIGALFVRRECQGQGIGRALLDHCREHYDNLNLKVYAKNEKAVKFYEAMGFTIDEEQTDEDTGEQEYIMSWVSDTWLDTILTIQC